MPSLAAYGNIDYIVVIHTFLLLSPLNVFCMFETYQSIGMVPRSHYELSSGLDQLAPFWRVQVRRQQIVRESRGPVLLGLGHPYTVCKTIHIIAQQHSNAMVLDCFTPHLQKHGPAGRDPHPVDPQRSASGVAPGSPPGEPGVPSHVRAEAGQDGT